MSMFQLALKNVKRNFYNYLMYFLSMIFSVIIYFVFRSIQYNGDVEKLAGGSRFISSAFNGASIVLIIFITIFIWYSNSFFIKKRKKEVALYSMMGVKKKQIGRMLFYETLTMGFIASVIGVFLGSLFSKLFIDLLVNVMGISATIKYSISYMAIIKTVVAFSAIFIVASIHGYSLIYRFELIELFRAQSKAEKPPKASFIALIIGILLIGFGYYVALNALTPNFFIKGVTMMFIALFGSIIVGTYLFFKNFTAFVVKIFKNNEAYYYKGINMIGVSQLQYRFKTNARTLTIIALLSASTLAAIGSSYSLYYMNEKSVRISNPFDVQFVENNKEKIDIRKMVGTENIKRDLNLNLLRIGAEYKSGGRPPMKLYEKADDIIYVISQKNYNDAIHELNKDEFKVNLTTKNEAYLLDSTESSIFKGEYKNTKYTLNLKDKVFNLNVIDRKKFDITNSRVAGLVAVVSDETFKELYRDENLIKVSSIILKEGKEKVVSSNIKKSINDKSVYEIGLASFYDEYNEGVKALGLMLFISGFLGVIFLICTGSIIYFKQLTEANEDKPRYEVLRKIGVKNKEIKATIRRQVLVIFLLPLILGISHGSFAILTIAKILGFNYIVPVVISFGAYILIYGVYYILTVREYYNIISKKA